METSDAGLIGAVIAMAQIIGRFAERLLDKVLKEKDPQEKAQREAHQACIELNSELRKLIEWHNVRDADGVFIWYFRLRELNKRFDDLEDLVKDLKNKD